MPRWGGKSPNDILELVFLHGEHVPCFHVGEVSSMLLVEPKLHPRAEGHVEGVHNLGGDASLDELLVGDSHALHFPALALEAPELREVDPEVCQGVHGKHCHVQDVCDLDAPALDPLGHDRLGFFQLLGRQTERAQLAPGEVFLFDIVPGKRQNRLIPPSEQSGALIRGYRYRNHMRTLRIYIFRTGSGSRDDHVSPILWRCLR